MYYEHPDLMRAHGNEHLAALIAEAEQERLAARAAKKNVLSAQIRVEIPRWARPNRRVAVKGI